MAKRNDDIEGKELTDECIGVIATVAEELVSQSVPFLLVTGYGARDGDPPIIKAAPRLKKPFNDLGRRMAEVFVPIQPTPPRA